VLSVLERKGYSVVEAVDASEALAVSGTVEQKIDLLISGVILSSARGTDIATCISVLRPALPILFINGYGIEELVSRGLLGSDRFPSSWVSFLQKPFMPETLLDSPTGDLP